LWQAIPTEKPYALSPFSPNGRHIIEYEDTVLLAPARRNPVESERVTLTIPPAPTRTDNVVAIGVAPRPIPIEDAETLAARIVAADQTQPGYAQAVIDAIIEKLNAPPAMRD